MDDRDKRDQSRNSEDVSPQALSVARMLDRFCRRPGLYGLTVKVPAHRRNPWRVRLALAELLRDTTTAAGRSEPHETQE